MSINLEKTPILYSVGSDFSFKVNSRYYNDVHYVWCTTKFDRKNQPKSSNPMNICKRYLDQIVTGDRHTIEIERNKVGILCGAQAKLEEGIINTEQFNEICELTNYTRYEDFIPIIYVIDAKKVGRERCIEVEKEKRASDNSIEYLITHLSHDEYDIIDLKKLLSEFIDYVDKKAGE